MKLEQHDLEVICEFNRIVKNYIKMNRIADKIELNEKIIINGLIFNPIKIIGELPNGYRVFEVEHTSFMKTSYKQMHELHLIEIKKRSKLPQAKERGQNFLKHSNSDVTSDSEALHLPCVSTSEAAF